MSIPIIYMHNPKSGGSSLNQIVSRQYDRSHIMMAGWRNVSQFRENLPNVPLSEREKVRLLLGHMDFGLHEFFPQRLAYFTFLRTPVDRMISHYYYVRRKEDHYLHQWMRENNPDLTTYVLTAPTPETDNHQVRSIANINVPNGQVTQEHLEQAIENINEHFIFVGIMEMFDESILLAKQYFQWERPVYYVKRNVTTNRPCMSQISRDVIKTISDHNKYDVELYQYCIKRVTQDIQNRGVEFQKDVSRFQSMNKLYNSIPDPLRKVVDYALLNRGYLR